MSIKIMLAEPHTIFRYGIFKIFESDDQFSVIGECEDGPGTVDLALKLCPDILLTAINLPNLNGIEVARRVVAENPAINVIALSAYARESCVMDFLNAGGKGYVTKFSSFSQLKGAIQAVIKGNQYLSVDVAGMVVSRALRPPSSHHVNHTSPLTAREREILQLISEGKTSYQVSTLLNISKRTVDNHRKNIMDKLDIHSIAELTRYAIINGLTFLS